MRNYFKTLNIPLLFVIISLSIYEVPKAKVKIMGSINTPNKSYSIHIDGDYLYIANGKSGLQIYDISDSSDPIPAGNFIIEHFTVVDITVKGQYAYLANAQSRWQDTYLNGLYVIDISDPLNPTLHNSFYEDVSGHSASTLKVFADENYIYSVHPRNSTIKRLNNTNTKELKKEGGFYVGNGRPTDVYALNKYMFISSDAGEMLIVGIINEHGWLGIIGKCDTPGRAYGIFVTNEYAYVADNKSGLQIIDIKNPEKPTLISETDTPGRAHSVYVDNEYAYVADGKSGLQIIDVSNPNKPLFLENHNTPGEAMDVKVVGSLAYIADLDSGVVILDVSEITKDYSSLVKMPEYPPVLTGKVEFKDPSNNSALDATEVAQITVSISNVGKGEAYNLIFNVIPESGYDLINIKNPDPVKKLDPAESYIVDIPISAGIDVVAQQVSYIINISEGNGFDLNPPLKISFGTREFQMPNLVVFDYAIEDFNNNHKIERSEIVKIIIRIQNQGVGKASGVKARIGVGKNVFITPDSQTEYDLGSFKPGEFRDIEFSLFTNNKATGIPVAITLTEKHEKYGSSKELDLPFDVVQKQATELVIRGKEKPIVIPVVAPALIADVDKDIPVASIRNNDAIAVVIGNSDYNCRDVPRVDYALNDAYIMKQYLIKSFGFREGNIIYLENAKFTDFRSVFGSAEQNGRLANMIKEGKSDVFIYYSGHGVPELSTNQGYFLPVDCCPEDIRVNGYPLKTFYKNISELNCRSLIVAIDACFSGGSNNGMLIKQASPIFINVEDPMKLKDNVIVFTSSAGDEISSWYPEKKHGLFTYFFLKGLRGDADSNSDAKITGRELHEFLSDRTNGVPYWARVLHNGRKQTPGLNGNSMITILKNK